MTFWVITNFCIRNYKNFVLHSPMRCRLFCVLNAVNLSKENEKLATNTCASPKNTTMKRTFKKVFSDISSLEHKNVPLVKEVETINFSRCKDVNEKKKSYGRRKGANFCKQGRLKHCFKCNSAQHLIHDRTGLRNNINFVMESASPGTFYFV